MSAIQLPLEAPSRLLIDTAPPVPARSEPSGTPPPPPAPILEPPVAATPAPAVEVTPPSTAAPAAEAVADTPAVSSPAPPQELSPDVERLLSEGLAQLRQGLIAEAEAKLAQAKEQVPEHPAVLELEGDIAFEKRRFSKAEQCYRKAFQADRTNTRLEEKFATALVKVHEPEFLAHDVPDDSPWSNRVRRVPAASGAMSMLLPGLGQFHNGDYLKGAILIFSWVMLLVFLVKWPIMLTIYRLHEARLPIDPTEIIAACFRGPNLILVLLLLGVWLYGIIDAAITAQNPG